MYIIYTYVYIYIPTSRRVLSPIQGMISLMWSLLASKSPQRLSSTATLFSLWACNGIL